MDAILLYASPAFLIWYTLFVVGTGRARCYTK
jgi:hypothetical protein